MNLELTERSILLAERQAAHCRVCGNPKRILILWLLAEKERTLEEIASAIETTPINAARHLRILAFSNFIKRQQEGEKSHYQIDYNETTRKCPIFLNRPDKILMEENPI